MDSDRVDTRSTVSGDRATIPARIRQEFDIEEGDRLQWTVGDDGAIRVEVIHQRRRTFSEFDGYEGDIDTDVTAAHDAWGIE